VARAVRRPGDHRRASAWRLKCLPGHWRWSTTAVGHGRRMAAEPTPRHVPNT
jgi:hypothetical protein